jgi:peptidyl-prolyl isomerase G (cyclophilin G)
MANRGPNTNTSQFFITLSDCSQLTSKHTLFGRVIDGLSTLSRISTVAIDERDRPVEPIKVSACGEEVVTAPTSAHGQGKEEAARLTGDAKRRAKAHASSIFGGVGGGEGEEPPSRGRSRTPVPSNSPKPRRHARSASPRRHHRRHHRSHSQYRQRPRMRDDDPDGEERIRREEFEREREGRRAEPEVTFKGRGVMRYRERKLWGGGGEYGRLD